MISVVNGEKPIIQHQASIEAIQIQPPSTFLLLKDLSFREMDSKEHRDDSRKKRQAEERKLIEEVRYKRSCIRLTPSFPSENEIQRKILKFGEQRCTFRKQEGRSVQESRREAICRDMYSMERIRSTAESLSVAYEMYDFLVMSDSALKESRRRFYDTDEDGIPIEPVFIADFVRKELDFFADFKHEKELQEKYEHMCQQIKEQNKNIKNLSEKVYSISTLVTKVHELLKNGEKEDRPSGKGRDEALQGSGEGDPWKDDIERAAVPGAEEEDILDIHYDYEFVPDQSDSKTRHTTEPNESIGKEKADPQQHPGAKSSANWKTA
ncbi:hypothetical protein COOONC_00590 [Cooperia oncophora]